MSGGESIKARFEHALGLAEDARRAWLTELAQTDPEAASAIERLLTLDAKRVDPFGQAVDSLKRSLDFDADAWLGRDFAGYHIERLLGEGGMGAVYLANRAGHDFEQLVALKLLRGTWLDRGSLARFAAERAILARLHHPNIATLIDAGADAEGRPFLAMEYIEGEPLLDYADAHQLDLDARLRLIHGLLSALAYAHRALIIHRDLKPANVLVTPDGIPKLLDFGIARLLAPDGAAPATSTRPFTPEYASPEQMAGDPVGTGSDIYSLGLVLYQLCVGVLPWDRGERLRSGGTPTPPLARYRRLDGARRAELAKARGVDAQRLARSLRGDFGRVVEHCLDPDPARRYATVEALTGDIDAILDHRPPPGLHISRGARARAFARRHAWPLALAMILVVAAAAFMVQTLRGAQRLQAERDRAVAAAGKAKLEATKSHQIAEFVEAMLSGIDPDRAHGMDRSLMRMLLDSASHRASRELATQPAVRTVVERTIGASYNSIGEYGKALAHFDDALEAADQSGANAEVRATLLILKARVLANHGRHGEARKAGDKARVAAASLAPDSRTRLRVEATLAGFQCDDGKLAPCRNALERIVPIQRRALGSNDADTQESIGELAYAKANLGDFAGAEALFKEQLGYDREHYGEADSRTLDATNGLAITYLRAKRFAAAETLLKPAVKAAEKTFGPDHPLTIAMLSNLGGAIRQQPGRNAEARPYYQRVLAATLKRNGPDSLRSVFAEVNMASLLRDAGDLGAAERHVRAAVAHMDKAFGPHSSYRGMVLDALATVLIRERKFSEAESVLTKAWSIERESKHFSTSDQTVSSIIDHFGELYDAWHKPAAAAKWRAKAPPPAPSHSGAAPAK